MKNPFLANALSSSDSLKFNNLPQLTNINNFESSSFWFSKRNYFTLQPKFYTTLNVVSMVDSNFMTTPSPVDSIVLMQESVNLDFILSNAQLHFTKNSLHSFSNEGVSSSNYSTFVAMTNNNVFSKSINFYLLNISLNSKSDELSYTFFKFLEPNSIVYPKVRIN
jgi:hypothetical protein